jgi:hypothetical protein
MAPFFAQLLLFDHMASTPEDFYYAPGEETKIIICNAICLFICLIFFIIELIQIKI